MQSPKRASIEHRGYRMTRMPLNDSLFLVAVPKGRFARAAQALQQEIAHLYNLYDAPLPPLHVTFEVIRPRNAEELHAGIELIRAVTRRFDPFYVHLDDFHAFPAPFLALTLRVVPTVEVLTLSSALWSALTAVNLQRRDTLAGWVFHLTLASATFAQRPWSEQLFAQVASTFASKRFPGSFWVDRLELWRPSFAPVEVAATFKLGTQPRP